MATIPKCKFDVEVCGATFLDEGCVRCGNMVSGRGWFDQHLYMPEFMRMLKAYSLLREPEPVAVQAQGWLAEPSPSTSATRSALGTGASSFRPQGISEGHC